MCEGFVSDVRCCCCFMDWQGLLDTVAEVLAPKPLQWTGRVSWEWKSSRYVLYFLIGS